MTFAEKLQKELNKSGMTRAELADKAGISRPMITNYLKGGYKAKQNNIFKLARALNISENDLIEDEYVSDSYNESPTLTYYLDPETAEMAEELKNNPGMKMLFDASRNASQKDLEIAASLLKQLKGDDE